MTQPRGQTSRTFAATASDHADAPERRRSEYHITCPAGKDHEVSMEHVTLNGVRMGSMVPWCRACRHEVPHDPPPLKRSKHKGRKAGGA